MTVTEQEITDYVARVRAALADLPPDRLTELTEDLADHLTEVAAEAEGTLVERLGEPETYAAELRAAAGVGAGGGRNLDQRVATAVVRLRGRLRAIDTRLGPPLGYATASDFLRLLRPGWWVVRGYLAAMLLTVITTGGSFGVLPRFGGELLAGLIMLIGFVLASIWLGRRSAQLTRWPRSAVQVGSAVLVVFALSALVQAEDRMRYGDYGIDPTSINGPYDNVRDVFVYDSEGRLVENARLFDQNGNPIRLGYPGCEGRVDEYGNPLLRPYPYCPSQAPFGPRAPGAPVPPTIEPQPTDTSTPSQTPAVPTPTPTTASPSVTPSATPSGDPTPTATS
ncbi:MULTISPECIES: HAAS signaling domain-containing protein [unclassified Micromonospora]|uniref:HAAS signaling domain-containing protein n=1 Tax=unclassified Micromonospora TaxID=2617518 RepID=UPI0033A6FB92